MGLISQVKEAESHRNREMRKFAEYREHHVEQQAEMVSDWRSQQSPLVYSTKQISCQVLTVWAIESSWPLSMSCHFITWQSLDEISSI